MSYLIRLTISICIEPSWAHVFSSFFSPFTAFLLLELIIFSLFTYIYIYLLLIQSVCFLIINTFSLIHQAHKHFVEHFDLEESSLKYSDLLNYVNLFKSMYSHCLRIALCHHTGGFHSWHSWYRNPISLDICFHLSWCIPLFSWSTFFRSFSKEKK